MRLPGRRRDAHAAGAGSQPLSTTTAARSRRARLRLRDLLDALHPAAIRRRSVELQRRLGLTRSGQVAIVGAVGLWVAARIVAGTAMFLFAYGALILVVVSYLIAPRRLRLQGERAGLFPRAQEGDRLDVEVRLTARRSVSTFVLEERVPERLGTPVRVPVAKLPSGGEVSHRYGLRCSRRGVYQIGPLVAVASDPLGIVQRETVVAEPFELLVHPRVELVSDRPLTRQFEDPPIRPPVSKPWPSGLEFYGMREFAFGDDLRRIVWRATARTGKLMVREAEQGITDRITIILDNDRATHSRDGEGLSESFETAVRVAASLGIRHLREGYEVTTVTNGGPLTRPLRGAQAQLLLLDALARLEQARQPLDQALMHLVANPRRDAHMVLVTPKLEGTAVARTKLLLNRGVSVLVVALLWDEDAAATLSTAAALGCQVVGVNPGQDLTSALYQEVGAGAGRR